MNLHPPTAPYPADVDNLPTPTAAPAPSNGAPATVPRAPRQVSQTLLERLRTLDDPAGAEISAKAPRRRWIFAVFGVLVLGLLGASGWPWFTLFDDPFKKLSLELQPVERGKVTFTIVEKGELEAFKNTKLVCKVRNRSG